MTSTSAAGDEQPGVGAEPRAAPEEGRKLPDLGQHRRETSRRIQGRVHGGGGGKKRGDRHDREACVAERRPRRLGDRGLAVADDLRDRQRAEDTECDQDVEHGRHAQGAVHGTRELSGGVAQVAGGEGDHAEAEVGEERERHAGEDLREGRIPAEGEQIRVDVDDRDRDENGEDGEQENDDHRLRLVHDARADQVDRRHPDHDGRGEERCPTSPRRRRRRRARSA